MIAYIRNHYQRKQKCYLYRKKDPNVKKPRQLEKLKVRFIEASWNPKNTICRYKKKKTEEAKQGQIQELKKYKKYN